MLTVKKIITKKQTRQEINLQIADYLQLGGEVKAIQRGISGRLDTAGPLKPDNSGFSQPKAERTYVPEVIAAMEQRKQALHPSSKKPSKPKSKPKKKIIYDDFGEAVRWEWVTE